MNNTSKIPPFVGAVPKDARMAMSVIMDARVINLLRKASDDPQKMIDKEVEATKQWIAASIDKGFKMRGLEPEEGSEIVYELEDTEDGGIRVSGWQKIKEPSVFVCPLQNKEVDFDNAVGITNCFSCCFCLPPCDRINGNMCGYKEGGNE